MIFLLAQANPPNSVAKETANPPSRIVIRSPGSVASIFSRRIHPIFQEMLAFGNLTIYERETEYVNFKVFKDIDIVSAKKQQESNKLNIKDAKKYF